MLVIFYPEETLRERDRLINLVEEEIFSKNSSDRGLVKDFVAIIGRISSLPLLHTRFFPETIRVSNYEEMIKKVLRKTGFNHFPIYVYEGKLGRPEKFGH